MDGAKCCVAWCVPSNVYFCKAAVLALQCKLDYCNLSLPEVKSWACHIFLIIFCPTHCIWVTFVPVWVVTWHKTHCICVIALIVYCSDLLNAYVAICARYFGQRVSPRKFGTKKECLQLLQLLSLHNTTHICFIGRRLFCVSALILLCFKMHSNANSRCFFSGDFIQAEMN